MSIPGPAGQQPGDGRRRLDLEPGGTQECIRFRKGKKTNPCSAQGRCMMPLIMRLRASNQRLPVADVSLIMRSFETSDLHGYGVALIENAGGAKSDRHPIRPDRPGDGVHRLHRPADVVPPAERGIRPVKSAAAGFRLHPPGPAGDAAAAAGGRTA